MGAIATAGIREQKEAFETALPTVLDSAMLTFTGLDPADAARPYSTSLPFQYKGETYLFVRVDALGDPADSSAVLFKKVGKDRYDRVRDFPRFEIQDPYI